MKPKYFLILDTETAPALPPNGGKVDGARPRERQVVYDIGGVLLNNRGEEITRFSCLIEEIFCNSALMSRAYYAAKIPDYIRAVARHETAFAPWNTLCEYILAEIAPFEPVLVAYNAGFDTQALRNTADFLQSYNPFEDFPVYDLWGAACSTVLATRKYCATARAQGWTTPKGYVQTNAQACARYLLSDYELTEKHTALSDAELEADIFRAIRRRKKSTDYSVRVMPCKEVWKHDNSI